MGLLDFLLNAAVVGAVGYSMLDGNNRESFIRDHERRGDELERYAKKKGYSDRQISTFRERYDEQTARMREASDRFGKWQESWNRHKDN